MQNRSESRQGKAKSYIPKPETLALLKVSGNPINGLNEMTPRRPAPFFWHPPEQHPYGELQIVARQSSRKCPGSAPAFMAAYNHPDLIHRERPQPGDVGGAHRRGNRVCAGP